MTAQPELIETADFIDLDNDDIGFEYTAPIKRSIYSYDIDTSLALRVYDNSSPAAYAFEAYSNVASHTLNSFYSSCIGGAKKNRVPFPFECY